MLLPCSLQNRMVLASPRCAWEADAADSALRAKHCGLDLCYLYSTQTWHGPKWDSEFMSEFTQHYNKGISPLSFGAQQCSEDGCTGVLPKDQNMALYFCWCEAKQKENQENCWGTDCKSIFNFVCKRNNWY